MSYQPLSTTSPILKNGFLSSSSIVFVGSFVVNILNYVFTIAMGRMMGVEAFGEVTTMLSLFLVISVPSTALVMLMTREVAFHVEGGKSLDNLFLFLRRHVFILAFSLWLIFVLIIPLMSTFFHISYLFFLVFSMLIPLLAMGAFQIGTLQGLQEFFILSKQNVLNTLIKLILSVFFVYLGFSVLGVMFSLVLAQIAGLLYGYFAIRETFNKRGGGQSIDVDKIAIRNFFLNILITTLFLAILSNIDVLLAKHYLSRALAGQYSALSTLGKIIIYGLGAFTTVLLPMASVAHARGNGEEKRILLFSLIIIALVSMLASILFSTFPLFFVGVLFGERYLLVTKELGSFSIAMGCIALSTTLINYFVAIRNTSFIYFLGFGVLFEILLIVFNHSSLASITNMLLMSSITLLVLLVLNYFITHDKPFKI